MGKGWLALAFLGTLPLALAASEHETPAPREVNLGRVGRREVEGHILCRCH